MNNKYLYLKNDSKSSFFKYINNKNIKDYYIFNEKQIGYKILKKIKLENSIIFGSWKRKIKDVKYVILGENGYSNNLSKYIKKKNHNCKIIMYFWNIMNETYKSILKDKNIDEFWTFDREEAKKYNFKYNPQFYTNKIKLKEKNIEQDVIFLGRAKKRKSELLKLQDKLKCNGITNKFIIIEMEKELLSYDKYLDLISKSKCILDYNEKGQIGLTLRPMEALFLEKKLITNNKDIKNYDFYNPNNIFILGEDNIENIKEFMNKPYEKVEQRIIDYYDFEQWLSRFEV